MAGLDLLYTDKLEQDFLDQQQRTSLHTAQMENGREIEQGIK